MVGWFYFAPMKNYIEFLACLRHYYRYEPARFVQIRDSGFFGSQYDRLVKGERGTSISDGCLEAWTMSLRWLKEMGGTYFPDIVIIDDCEDIKY